MKVIVWYKFKFTVHDIRKAKEKIKFSKNIFHYYNGKNKN